MRHLVVLVAVLMTAVACGPVSETSTDNVEIDIEDHPDALTDQGDDNLFYLELVDADRDYELSEIAVSGGLPGETRSDLNFELENEDADVFAEGERLLVKEPGVNLFDEDTVGETVEVSLSEYSDSTWWQISRGEWKPED